MSDERWPCQRNPDRWFSTNRRELGRAKHECLSHCPRLAECDATQPRPAGGVLAGVRYIVTDAAAEPRPERRTLHEVPCDGCELDPKPKPERTGPTDTGACGTSRGFHRHAAANEYPCEPCRVAKTEYQREYWRAWRIRVRGAA